MSTVVSRHLFAQICWSSCVAYSRISLDNVLDGVSLLAYVIAVCAPCGCRQMRINDFHRRQVTASTRVLPATAKSRHSCPLIAVPLLRLDSRRHRHRCRYNIVLIGGGHKRYDSSYRQYIIFARFLPSSDATHSMQRLGAIREQSDIRATTDDEKVGQQHPRSTCHTRHLFELQFKYIQVLDI